MLEITIDSREQTPWHFDATLVHAVRGTVRTGDYCVTGDAGFAIERKSLNDFIGTVSSGWDRFQRELYRARNAGFSSFPIIVEARFSDILFAVQDNGEIVPPPHDHPNCGPAFVLKRIGEIEMAGGSVRFADGPIEAAMLATAILYQRYLLLNHE